MRRLLASGTRAYSVFFPLGRVNLGPHAAGPRVLSIEVKKES